MTASKFRPAVNNPYLLLTRDDDDDEVVEMDRVSVFISKFLPIILKLNWIFFPLKYRVTHTGLTETVVQVGRHKNSAKHHAVKNGTQEEKEALVSAEGSHELDWRSRCKFDV